MRTKHAVSALASAAATLALMAAALLPALPAPAAENDKMEKYEFPHAGAAIAAPKNFEAQPPEEATDVLRAVQMDKGQAVAAVNLSVYPMDKAASVDDFADRMVTELQKSLAIRHLAVKSKMTMPVAGQTGSVRLLTYAFRGVETVAARVFFIREMKESKANLCYVVTVELAQDRQASLIPLLRDVLPTVQLTEMKHPYELTISKFLKPVKNTRQGISALPPLGWVAVVAPDGIIMVQTDYLAGTTMPQVKVMVSDSAGTATSQAMAEKFLEMAKKASAKSGVEMEVVSQGAAKLLGQDAYQFVVRQSARKAASAPAAAPAAPGASSGSGATATSQATSPAEDKPVLVVHRTLIASGESGDKCYSILLICQDADPRWAAAQVDKLAEGVALIAPATSASSSSATTTAPGK